MRSAMVLVGLWVGCSEPARPGASLARSPAPVGAPVTPVAASPPVAACAEKLDPHREILILGRETEIAWGGRRATYHGRTHDSYADGTTATLLDLEVFGQRWLPDARDRGYHPFGEHCVRLASVDDQRIELDVALLPAHQFDPGRCHQACCVTEAQQAPAPGGEVECCFCADTP